jgi:hypothetical protein
VTIAVSDCTPTKTVSCTVVSEAVMIQQSY